MGGSQFFYGTKGGVRELWGKMENYMNTVYETTTLIYFKCAHMQ